MTPVLELENFTGGHRGMAVVRGVDMYVDPGEVVSLLGPNGAGKTTTLLTISGLLPVLGGDIRVFGRSVTSLRAHQIPRLGVAHVPDDRSLVSSLSVLDNLRLAAKGADITPVYEHFPQLESLANRRAGLLSGGEQQMLAVGRALLIRPKLLLIDEMSLGLAPIIVQRLLPIVKDIARQTGAGVLLVEQHIEMALQVSDRGYLLVHGDLVRHGAASELLADRRTIEAGYVGASSLEE